jgi:hypothetical protein
VGEPLPNRVRPDGSLIASKSRGMFTGNRGIIHDPDTRQLTGRRWTTPAWICCSLEWKGRRRDVWGRNRVGPDGTKGVGWSELFFLDEVTAFAAGHRPCHMCRNSDAKTFHSAFCAANGRMDAAGKNRLLHTERWLSSHTGPTALSPTQLDDLPDAAMVQAAGRFLALKNAEALPWSFEGYGNPVGLAQISDSPVLLVTPPSIIGALREGYQPHWHVSAV